MQQGTGTSKPEYTEARDFTQTPRPASLAQSVASAPNACRESENIRGSSTGHDDASLHSDLGPELARRYTTIIPARGRRQDAQESCHTLPMTSDSTKRPFFISPFLKTPKTSRDVSPARNPEANLFRTRIAQPEKRNTDDTEKSSCTKEWEHHVRMEQKRRVREFPRRLVTSIIGGIFVIVPMVALCHSMSATHY